MKNKIGFLIDILSKRIWKIIVLVFIVMILIWYWFYEKLWKKAIESEKVFIKNNSWDSDLSKDTPYIKGDEVEILYFWEWNANIDLSVFEDNIDIKKIKIWEKEVDIDEKKSVNIENIDNKPLKIIWKALKNKEDIEENFWEAINNEKVEKNTEDNNDKIKEEKIKIDDLEKKEVKNISLSSYNFYSNIDNLIELSWENIENIKFMTILDSSFSPIFKDWKALFEIEKNIFDKWEYFAILQTSSWVITLDKTINFVSNKDKSESEIKIINITPNIIKNEKSIILQWEWFSKIISIQLSNTVVIEKTDFRIINDKVLAIAIPEGIPNWEYHLNIMTTGKIIQLDSNKFIINR